jgi:hypothetical protein
VWGQGGEMTQALYAHMNNKIKKNCSNYNPAEKKSNPFFKNISNV